MKKNNQHYMLEALQAAEKGRGWVEPNPLVGAMVLDARGHFVSRGYHRRLGGAHAEVDALMRAGKRAQGGTLIVTLEPCSTQGKTPPCTEAILRSGIQKIMIGAVDPNPMHRGRGLRILKKKGLKVTVGLQEEAVKQQNAHFFKFMKTGLPFVSLKLAESLDGKIATVRGESRWITSLESRKQVQKLRASHQAILVGTNTLKQDAPGLRVKDHPGRHPHRIFVSRNP